MQEAKAEGRGEGEKQWWLLSQTLGFGFHLPPVVPGCPSLCSFTYPTNDALVEWHCEQGCLVAQ